MDNKKPNKAFILAAGQGTRLRPYTDDKPKPMVDIAGSPLIKYILQKLEKQNISEVIVNLHYLGDKIKNTLKSYNKIQIHFSEESELLETGGGVKKVLPLLKGEDFFLINGDAFWTDNQVKPSLESLAESWDPDEMDILLLLQPVRSMKLTEGIGDYDLDENGRAKRNKKKQGEYMFTGIRISKSTLFDNTPESSFSYLKIMDRAEENETLFGVVNKGQWHHISTPQDLDNVNAYIKENGMA